jgi:hypothetical protein
VASRIESSIADEGVDLGKPSRWDSERRGSYAARGVAQVGGAPLRSRPLRPARATPSAPPQITARNPVLSCKSREVPVTSPPPCRRFGYRDPLGSPPRHRLGPEAGGGGRATILSEVGEAPLARIAASPDSSRRWAVWVGGLYESRRPGWILHCCAESLPHRLIWGSKAARGFTLGPEHEDARW